LQQGFSSLLAWVVPFRPFITHVMEGWVNVVSYASLGWLILMAALTFWEPSCPVYQNVTSLENVISGYVHFLLNFHLPISSFCYHFLIGFHCSFKAIKYFTFWW
jgi:hypothetical protein